MRLASVRRSLFTNDAARSKFLAHLMTGTKVILQTGQGVVGLILLCLTSIAMSPNLNTHTHTHAHTISHSNI